MFEVTRPFAEESRWRSFATVAFTVFALGLTLFAAGWFSAWPVRVAASVIGGLLIVRTFILYHDYMHGSLLRDSRWGKALFAGVGLLFLAPSSYWRYSHNYHHGTVGKSNESGNSAPGQPDLVISDLGAFPLMSTDSWRKASFMARLRYRISRHPLTLLLAYVTVFFYGLTIYPLMLDPKKYWDGAVALVLHGGVIASLWIFAGVDVALFAFIIPFSIASAIGAYLFFVQHNFEDMAVLDPEEWTFYRGATESSSRLTLDPLMHWFTGYIGYHHLHHLNPRIPFYRLPEAFKAIPELQETKPISLSPACMWTCLRLHLWDPKQSKLVTYREARRAA